MKTTTGWFLVERWMAQSKPFGAEKVYDVLETLRDEWIDLRATEWDSGARLPCESGFRE